MPQGTRQASRTVQAKPMKVDSTFKCNQSYKETPWQKNVKEFLYIYNGKNSVRHCTYTYDHSDRISSVTHKLNSGSTVTLASYTYDNKGRLTTKKLHGSSSNQLTYAYNIRSWLTGISSNKFTQT